MGLNKVMQESDIQFHLVFLKKQNISLLINFQL